MRKFLKTSLVLLNIFLIACGQPHDMDEQQTPINYVDSSNSTSNSSEIETEQHISIPFECEVTISDESGTDYYGMTATMDSLEQINTYASSALEIANEYPNSVFSFSLKDSVEQLLISIDNGSVSVISTDSDGENYFDYPSWYSNNSSENAKEILLYAFSQAEKGTWKNIE